MRHVTTWTVLTVRVNLFGKGGRKLHKKGIVHFSPCGIFNGINTLKTYERFRGTTPRSDFIAITRKLICDVKDDQLVS